MIQYVLTSKLFNDLGELIQLFINKIRDQKRNGETFVIIRMVRIWARLCRQYHHRRRIEYRRIEYRQT